MKTTAGFLIALALPLLIGGCASAQFTKLSKNQAVISTRAAPVCHTTGAVSVANQMAAISTIREGYQRFIVLGIGSQDNTRVFASGPTYANTTGQVTTFGNTAYGSARTTYGGSTMMVAGSNNAQMQIVMLNPGDDGFENGIDARQTLGPDWQKRVDEGITNCLG